MKLLLDENLSRRLVPFLQHDSPGSYLSAHTQPITFGCFDAAARQQANYCVGIGSGR